MTEKELNLTVLMNALEFYFKSIRETLDRHKVLKHDVNENHNYSKCYDEWLTKQCDLISGWVKKPDVKKDVEDNDFYVKFKDALPELIAGRRFRDSYPCGDDFQTLNEFVECSSFYILKILKGKVDLEPLDEVSKVKLKKRMSYEQT